MEGTGRDQQSSVASDDGHVECLVGLVDDRPAEVAETSAAQTSATITADTSNDTQSGVTVSAVKSASRCEKGTVKVNKEREIIRKERGRIC